MGVKLAPRAAMVAIFHAETGQRIERWPVDARAMVASGEYRFAPPAESEEAPAPEEEAPVAVTQSPAEYAPGVPLLVTRSEEAPGAEPVQLPDPGQSAPQPMHGRRHRGRR